MIKVLDEVEDLLWDEFQGGPSQSEMGAMKSRGELKEIAEAILKVVGDNIDEFTALHFNNGFTDRRGTAWAEQWRERHSAG